jgi:hypothetical protein
MIICVSVPRFLEKDQILKASKITRSEDEEWHWIVPCNVATSRIFCQKYILILENSHLTFVILLFFLQNDRVIAHTYLLNILE